MAKRALILAGGGVKVAYQAGVMQVWLDEAGLTFDHADGASGGVFNLVMYCQGMTGRQIGDNWRAFPVLSSIGLNWRQFLRLYWAESLMTYDKFRELVLRGRWGLDWPRINASKLTGTFNVYNFSKNEHRVIEQSGITEDLLVACVTLPMWFPPITIDGDRYIDAVYLTDANLMEAIRRGADELWIIWTVSNRRVWKGGFIDTYFQIIETTANGHLRRDLERIEASNAAIAAGKPGEFGRPIKVNMLEAEVPLHYLVNVAAPEFTAAVEQGIADARAWCRERGIALASDVPAPRHDLMTLTFSETMAGPFALGVTDPAEGARIGKEKGTRLALHGNIRIEAFDRFVNEPNHTGTLGGTVDFNGAGFGDGMPATGGVFNLFKPAGTGGSRLGKLFRGSKAADGKLKNFVYEMAFTQGGKTYYLAGRKNVGAGGDLWGETTTLYATLHEGTDAKGPVIGAGILTLGPDDLAKLLSTVKVENAANGIERLAVIIRFGHLFLGELWTSYARHVPGLP